MLDVQQPMRKARKPARSVRVARKTMTRKRTRMASLIVRLPPAALARLRAVAAVRRLPPGRVLAVALRLYERHLLGVLR